MVWESTLGCFTTGSFSDLQCLIGNGFSSLFGGPVFATIFMLLIGVYMAYKMRLPTDLSAMFIFSLILVGNLAFAPSWLVYVMIILLATVSGWGIYKFFKVRG